MRPPPSHFWGSFPFREYTLHLMDGENNVTQPSNVGVTVDSVDIPVLSLGCAE